jgi:signal transduction histidine kinase
VLGNRPEARTLPETSPGLKSQGLTLELPPGGARVLEFHYTANTFVAPEKARFKYRLIGLDDNWIDAGTRRQAYFTSLRPGSYRFELLACNHQGIWQEQSAAVAFYVAAFYYQTWWFYVLCSAGAVVLVAFLVRRRARESRRIYELERVNALNEQRRRIARDIHDELGSSLTHIMRLSGQARTTPERSAAPDPHTERIASIAGEAVDNIGEIVWANNPEYDTLEDLVAYLREHAASYFTDTDTKVKFDFPETVPDRPVTGLFRRHVVMVLKEALQNVTKHAGAQSVRLRLAAENETLELDIADDGRGLPKGGTRRFGNGLTNMRQRVEELKGTFRVDSEPGKGTEIRVVIPLRDP